jgi:hypothetical protein
MTPTQPRGWRFRRRTRTGPSSPVDAEITLGHLEPRSVAPAVFGLVDRGVMKRPELGAELACQVELRMTDYPPVRISFRRGEVLVEDSPSLDPLTEADGEEHDLGELALEPDEPDEEEAAVVPDPDTRERALAFQPDIIISGSLPDIVAITATPLFGGLPRLTDPRGRSALASIAGGRVRFRGSPRLVRQLLRLLQI